MKLVLFLLVAFSLVGCTTVSKPNQGMYSDAGRIIAAADYCLSRNRINNEEYAYAVQEGRVQLTPIISAFRVWDINETTLNDYISYWRNNFNESVCSNVVQLAYKRKQIMDRNSNSRQPEYSWQNPGSKNEICNYIGSQRFCRTY